MKKLFTILACVLLLAATCSALISCGAATNSSYIDFGKKYMHSENHYYVFNSDHTGYGYYHYSYDSLYGNDYVTSGRVEFVWREASDGAIYLFRTETHTDEDDSGYSTIPLIQSPIYFGEDFFAYRSEGVMRFIKEGSELEALIED